MKTYIQYDEVTGEIGGEVGTNGDAPDISKIANLAQIEVPQGIDTFRKKVNITTKLLEDAPIDEWDAFVDKYPLEAIVNALKDPDELAELQADAQNSRVIEVATQHKEFFAIKEAKILEK